MRILILDDDSSRHIIFAKRFAGHELTHTFDAWEALELMKTTKFDLVQLDHDLGQFEYVPYKVEVTGTEVANGMAQGLLPENRPDMVVIHSWNPAGARRMLDILREAEFNVFLDMFNNGEHYPVASLEETKPWLEKGWEF